MRILEKYKLKYIISDLSLNDFCYIITKNNNYYNNIDIIIEYINNGDKIETEIIKEELRKSKKIRQISHILLKKYLESNI